MGRYVTTRFLDEQLAYQAIQPYSVPVFNGTTDFLEGTNDIAFSPGAGRFTAVMWYNTAAGPPPGQCLVCKYDGTGNQKEWGLQVLGAGGWKFILSPDGLNNDGPVITTPDPPTPGTWAMLAGTGAPNDYRLSVNAGAQVQYTAFASLFQGTAPLRVGRLVGTSSTIWANGRGCAFGYWDRQLSPALLTLLWNGGARFLAHDLPADLLPGLVDYFDLGWVPGVNYRSSVDTGRVLVANRPLPAGDGPPTFPGTA